MSVRDDDTGVGPGRTAYDQVSAAILADDHALLFQQRERRGPDLPWRTRRAWAMPRRRVRHSSVGTVESSQVADGEFVRRGWPRRRDERCLRESGFAGGAGVDRLGIVLHPQVPGQIVGRRYPSKRDFVRGLPWKQPDLSAPD